MSAFKHDDLVRVFAERTLINLNFIEEHKTRDGLFEVTQLINSLLGLLVFPVEAYIKREDPNARFSEISRIRRACRTLTPNADADSAEGFLTLMRNAVAHCGLKLKGEGRDFDQGEIQSVFFWNYPDGDSTKGFNWKIEMPLDVLREFVSYLARVIAEKASKEN